MSAEQSLISAILLDNRCVDAAAARIRPEQMEDGTCRAVYSLILDAKGSPVDPVTLSIAAKAKGLDWLGLEQIHSLANVPASPNNVARYCELIAESAAARSLKLVAFDAIRIAEGSGTVAERVEAIQTALNAIQRTQMAKEPEGLTSAVARALERYEALAEGKREAAWSTGIRPLDEMFAGGLRPGKVYGLAARPSVGKSSAAREIAASTAQQGLPTLVLSQEMPIDEVTDCLVARLGRIDAKRLITGKLEQDDWSRMVEAADEASRLPIFIDDDGGLTLSQVAAKARMVKGLKVLVLDYLQLCTSDLRANTNDQVAEISKGLKRLALSMGIAIVVLSQLNRQVEQRQDKEPQLSDLRDSGAIEQDLDACVMLWTAKEEADSRLVGWKVAKNRSGNRGVFAMRFVPATYSWFPSDEPLRDAPVARVRRGFGHDDD